MRKLSIRGWVYVLITAFALLNLLPSLGFTPKTLATNHQVRINQVMTGANGNSAIQFIELEMCCPGENLWGPQAGESASRVRLVFFDAAGSQTGVFNFSSDPPSGNLSVLVATQAFADLPGAPTPDFIMPSGLLQAGSGKVVFTANPANPSAVAVTLALSYGSFAGNTEGAGSPAPALPATGAKSLTRQAAFRSGSFFGATSNSNSHFAVADAAPRNSAGQTGPMSFFADVAAGGCAAFIQAGVNAGVVEGCGGGNFCPDVAVTRAEMARILLRAKYGAAFVPPPATGTVFADVPANHPLAAWIEQLFAEGITAGCGGGNFCPDVAVTRAEMAVFLLRTKHGSSYVPPPATIPVFVDVPVSDPFAPWIHQIAAEGITTGCGCGNFCPNTSINRAVMTTWVVRAFSLPLPPDSPSESCEIVPLVISSLDGQIACAGATVTFTATVQGPASLTTTWKKGAQTLTNGALNGRVSITANSGTVSLSISNLQPSDADTYTLEAANTCGSQSASQSATLMVNVAPFVSDNPDSLTACAGSMVSFTASATGTPAPSIQWQRSTDNGMSFTDIKSETSASLQMTATPAQNGHQFRARFNNSCGSTFSNAAVLSVDQTAPVISCPAAQTRVTVRPGDAAVVVTYLTPGASDSCGATVVCTPPSGATFARGTTTVACTATDAAGNTASCDFTITVFDICLQDDSNSGAVLLWNSQTGDYRYCCVGVSYAGRGASTRKGNVFTLSQVSGAHRVTASVDTAANRGTASLQVGGVNRCPITDRDIRNNSCLCALSGT